jgi:hypothetical protein
MANKLPPYFYQYRFMKDATQNPRHPDYPKYGALGITCAWGSRQYKDFYRWLITTLGERPGPGNQYVLGRKDKRGNFEPGNLEWQTILKRSRTNHKQNVYATYRRQTKTLIQWSEDLNIPYHTFRRRYALGFDIKEIVKEFR